MSGLRIRRRVPVDAVSRGEPLAAARPFTSACYAPHTSMYFDQMGKVRACCQNTGVYLGDVRTRSLREIWASAEAEHLRSALDAGDYSAGCDFCAWQVREGNEAIVFARNFDDLRPPDARPQWPKQMEFSLTNTCNLQCTMCYGELSSTIRAKREGLPPLPVVYHDGFFEQLAEFLPHLDEAKFLGGEPFLGREPMRVMEMLAGLERPPRVTITTNGTIRTARVERIVTTLRPNIVVSIDGASAATFDAIRVGAHFDDVIANLDWFDRQLSGQVSVATCLMRQNWHEFGSLLQLVEERGMDVGVNVVRFPPGQSLYHLDAAALAEVVERMQQDPARLGLTGNRQAAWDGQLAALEHRLEVVRADDPSLGPVHGLAGAAYPPRWWMPFPEQRSDTALPLPSDPLPREVLADVDVDVDGITTVHPAAGDPALDLGWLDGEHVGRLTDHLLTRYRWADWAPRRPGLDDDRAVVTLEPLDPRAAAAAPPVDMAAMARRSTDGTLVGARYLLTRATDQGA